MERETGEDQKVPARQHGQQEGLATVCYNGRAIGWMRQV